MPVRPPIRFASFAAALAVTAWAGFTAVVTARQRTMLFSPVRERAVPRPRSTEHHTRNVVLRSVDGIRLCGWLLTPPSSGPHPAVVYFGGRSEEVSWLVRDAARMFPGMAVLALNYRGSGDSHGVPGERDLVADARMGFDWMASFGDLIDPQRIAIVGRSLGSSIALQVAACRPVAALVLLTPFDSVLAMVRKKMPTVPVGLVLRHKFESVKIAHQVTAPVLVLRAESDNIVPHLHTDALIARLPHLVDDHIVAGSDHLTIPYLDETQEKMRAFLLATLAEPQPEPGGDERDGTPIDMSVA